MVNKGGRAAGSAIPALTETFTEEGFWNEFRSDLSASKTRVLIQSPFATVRRVSKLYELFQLTKRGITVCAFLQEPRNKQESPEQLSEFKRATEKLLSWGVHVNLRKDIHAKFAVIDEDILWEGSLNILSFGKSKEHMRKWINKREAERIVVKYQLEGCTCCKLSREKYSCADSSSLKQLTRVGKLLTQRRLALNLSQREMARRCSLSSGRLSQIETGCNITITTLLELTDELEMEVLLVPALYVPALAKFLQEQQNRSL